MARQSNDRETVTACSRVSKDNPMAIVTHGPTTGDARNLPIRLQSRSAFTLIELLIVLAIIGVLTALVLPVIRMVRESTWQAGCGFKMTKCATAGIVFANENRKRLPRLRFFQKFLNDDPFAATPDLVSATRVINQAGSDPSIFWPEMIRPYLENNHVFSCPKLKLPATQSNGGGISRTEPLGIGINIEQVAPQDGYTNPIYTKASQFTWTTITRIPNPSQLIWFLDSSSRGPGIYNDDSDWKKRVDVPNAATLKFIGTDSNFLEAIPRHRNKANACFIDGHVATVAQDQVSRLDTPSNAKQIGFTDF